MLYFSFSSSCYAFVRDIVLPDFTHSVWNFMYGALPITQSQFTVAFHHEQLSSDLPTGQIVIS